MTISRDVCHACRLVWWGEQGPTYDVRDVSVTFWVCPSGERIDLTIKNAPPIAANVLWSRRCQRPLLKVVSMTISVVPFINDHFPLAEALSSPIYYPMGLWEPHAAFTSRLSLYPMGCMSIYHEGTYAGYLFSHPWRGGPVPLCTIINELPIQPDHYYIHDLCIAKPMQRMGLGNQLVNAALDRARAEHLHEVRLVSVLGSDTFWRAAGFDEVYRTNYAPGVIGIGMSRKGL